MTNSPSNDRFLRALRREPVDHTPVWLMRQAGRYLPEYRATRAKAGSFLALAKNPELACEVTLQPLERFPLDAAILFSDILTVPDAMGLGLYFVDGEGPKFERPICSAADIDRLAVPDMETELRYVMDAVRTIRRELVHSGAWPPAIRAASPGFQAVRAATVVVGQSGARRPAGDVAGVARGRTLAIDRTPAPAARHAQSARIRLRSVAA